MKIHSIKVITTGQGKSGPWTLVEATFEGQEGVYKGFYYDKPFQVGQEVEVEFSIEEYKGNMENRFKLLTKKALQANVAEMAIKTHIDQHFAVLRDDLRKIATHLGMEDVKKPAYPTEPNPDEIPF